VNVFRNWFGKSRSKEEKADSVSGNDQKEMIEAVEHLPETIVKEVMVPRTDTIFLPVEATSEEFLPIIIESGHSRIPVYRDSIDNVIGILYAKDVLAAMIRKKSIDLPSLLRKPFFVPETKRIDSLLKEFKRRHVHIAIVVDEYGGTSGIVCMEDIIEEIVGEIQDEYDDEAEMILEIGPRIWICDARVRLDELAQTTGIDFPSEEFDSLAGYVFDLFGRIPSEKERMDTEKAAFTIQKMEGHRILSVRIEWLEDTVSQSVSDVEYSPQ
jgi:CBS domain containing-hemolysin-like protein